MLSDDTVKDGACLHDILEKEEFYCFIGRNHDPLRAGGPAAPFDATGRRLLFIKSLLFCQ